MTILQTPGRRLRPWTRPASPGGFSTIAVILSMVFIAMGVMSMTTLFVHEAHRTQAALAQTQLRQLLLAAVPAAQAEVLTPAPRDVPLAVPVADAAVTLHVNGQTVRVTAVYRGFKAAQTLVFENGKLASATLDQTGGQ
jgi:Tfp pilus assembly protein PilV